MGVFEQFIVSVRGKGGHSVSNHRLVLDGIFWIARTDAQWRDLPEEFGKGSSVYRQFRRWTLTGLRDLVLETLNESKAVPDQVEMIDSAIIRAHHLSDGAKGGLKKKVLAAQMGASRSKFTSLPALTDCL